MRWVGLILACVGVVLIILGFIQHDLDFERQAVGSLILFIVITWAVLSRCLGEKAGSSLLGAGSMGGGFVLAGLASIYLQFGDATVVMSCAIYACVYVTALLIQMAISLREARASEERWIQVVQEEREQTGRDPRTGTFL